LSTSVHFVRTSDGHRLALTELRSRGRECFLLVHGFSQNRSAFLDGPLPSELASRGAHVFVGELRGHGLSDHHTHRDWSLSTHLDRDLPALIERARSIAGTDRVHVMGHSMGGMLGYALLARPEPIASLTTFAAPIALGRARPLVRFAALIAGPIVGLGRPRAVPINFLLKTLAPMLTDPAAPKAMKLVQELAGLVNPRQADAAMLKRILERSEPESPRVFVELANMAITGRAVIGGVDLMRAVKESPVAVACVVGTKDVFASRASVEPAMHADARGRRVIIELPHALHVDLTVGREVARTVDLLFDFLVRT
jgi:pimeloyl-ACP methyl ester carboxylesterase